MLIIDCQYGPFQSPGFIKLLGLIPLVTCICTFYLTEYICNNCSDIITDNKTNPPEIELCAGENISITIVAPPIFNISEDYWGASLRLNESNLDCNSKCCPIGDVRVSSVVYQCTNMEEADGGLYFGHNLISCAGISLEWCTQGVLINITNCSNGRNDSSLTATVVQTSSYSIYRNTSTESSSIRKCRNL